MDPATVRVRINLSRAHLKVVAELYKLQIDGGRFFLHEHPAGAVSWKDPFILRIRNRHDVDETTMDQCRYGLTTPDPNHDPKPAKKPTRWMSISRAMRARLSRRCTREHEHQPLMGGRGKAAELYPKELILEILRGMQDHEDDQMLAEEEENIFQRVASINSGFADENSHIYRPSMTYEFARRDALCAAEL